jgi:hypothetical protein
LIIKRYGGTFVVYPNLGVRHRDLHAVIDRLEGRNPGVTPTAVHLLGYLMPEHTGTVCWDFHASDRPNWRARAADLAEHVNSYGLPWMRQYVTLDAILADPDADNRPRDRRYRPVALMLLGRPSEAGRQLDADLDALAGRSDPAAGNFRRFANALRADLPTGDQEDS